MRMLITDLIADGSCEFTGKTGECLKVVFEQNVPPAVVSTKKFIELVRFQAQQQAKRAATTTPSEARPASPRTIDSLSAGAVG